MAQGRARKARGSTASSSSKRPVDVELSIGEARRVALAAQGFGRTYAGSDLARLSAVLDHVGVLQID